MARISADGQEYTYALALGTQANLTVCGWFKITTDRNDYSTIFSIDNGTGDNWLMQTGADGSTMAGVFDATTQENMGSLTVGTWYFICLSTAGTSGSIYYRTPTSPTLTTVAVTGVTASVNAATLRIGESPWGAEWWNGCINAVKVYTAQLTAAEALQESMQYTPTRTANLVAFYPLVRPETTDYSGNGRTLSGGSGATREDGPPIPWQGVSPRLTLPAASSGTTAVAECATATGAAENPVRAVSVSAVEATAAAAGQDPVAVTAVAAASTEAAATAAANNPTTAVTASAEPAAATASISDATSAVTASAAEATATAVGNDATVITGSVTTAAAEAATATATAHDPAPAVTTTAVEATGAASANAPTGSVTPAVAAATGTAVSLDASGAVAAAAEAATGVAVGNNATVATSGGTTAFAEAATAAGLAHDPAGQVVASPETATATGTASDPVGVTVVLAQAQTAAAAAIAHDPGVSIVVSIGTAEAQAVAWDADIPAQVSRGAMSPGNRPTAGITATDRPTAGMAPTVRTTATMTGG